MFDVVLLGIQIGIRRCYRGIAWEIIMSFMIVKLLLMQVPKIMKFTIILEICIFLHCRRIRVMIEIVLRTGFRLFLGCTGFLTGI